MSNLYSQVEQWLAQHTTAELMIHFKRTAFWAQQLKPNADEALLIAALAHDAERVFRGDVIPKPSESLREPDYLRQHQLGGAEIVGNFLKEKGADEELIKRVQMIIKKHEEGGDSDQNIIKDADSISFFENNVDYFLQNKIAEYGRENVHDKFEWMYNRITSAKAKEIVKPWYERAIKAIKKLL